MSTTPLNVFCGPKAIQGIRVIPAARVTRSLPEYVCLPQTLTLRHFPDACSGNPASAYEPSSADESEKEENDEEVMHGCICFLLPLCLAHFLPRNPCAAIDVCHQPSSGQGKGPKAYTETSEASCQAADAQTWQAEQGHVSARGCGCPYRGHYAAGSCTAKTTRINCSGCPAMSGGKN